MTQHSKGPWRQSPTAVDAIITDDPTGLGPVDGIASKYYGGFVVAESITPKNMPLICAAPDLLEACEEALAWIQDHTLVIALDVKDSLRMAIAKAKGQNPA